MHILPIVYHVLPPLYGRFSFLCLCHFYVRYQRIIHVTSSNFLYPVHAFRSPTLTVDQFVLHCLFHSAVQPKLRWSLWASQWSLSDLKWFPCLILLPTPCWLALHFYPLTGVAPLHSFHGNRFSVSLSGSSCVASSVYLGRTFGSSPKSCILWPYPTIFCTPLSIHLYCISPFIAHQWCPLLQSSSLHLLQILGYLAPLWLVFLTVWLDTILLPVSPYFPLDPVQVFHHNLWIYAPGFLLPLLMWIPCACWLSPPCTILESTLWVGYCIPFLDSSILGSTYCYLCVIYFYCFSLLLLCPPLLSMLLDPLVLWILYHTLLHRPHLTLFHPSIHCILLLQPMGLRHNSPLFHY